MVDVEPSPALLGAAGEMVLKLRGGWTAVMLEGDDGVILIQHGQALILESGEVVDLHDPRMVVSESATLVCRGLLLRLDGGVESGEYGLVPSGHLPSGRELLGPAAPDFNRYYKLSKRTLSRR
tara:strand:- start:245 stop:613 length:369 start_codon:yes stop_codon:yes gene_type:complete